MKTKETAISFALKKLSYKRFSVKELQDLLNKKEYSKAETEEAIDYCLTRKYLDDYDLAFAYIRDCVNYKKKGRYVIILELKNKGIANEIIEEAIREELPKQVEKEMALQMWQKWNADNAEKKSKYVSRLVRKGFSQEIIRNIINCDDYLEEV